MTYIWIFLGFVCILASIVVLIYNSLVAARQLVDNGWADIEVQLKRRVDLIPNLVDTVKAYASHEKQLFKEITAKRSEVLNAGQNLNERAATESALSRPISRLLAVAEDYPDLKANQNFLDLQEELSQTENKIEMARRFYNGAVRQNNTKVRSFPAILLAAPFGFGIREFFEIDTSDASNPHLSFEN